MQDRIPSLENMKARNLLSTYEDIWCRSYKEEVDETAMHIFFECKKAKDLWQQVEK